MTKIAKVGKVKIYTDKKKESLIIRKGKSKK
ncbi:MAG: hypothetical protein QOF54_8 [Solirubrobacteraceae bacterium]|nr:hypothetical protein [Solirubrobacteraceae bacterium]